MHQILNSLCNSVITKEQTATTTALVSFSSCKTIVGLRTCLVTRFYCQRQNNDNALVVLYIDDQAVLTLHYYYE